MGGNKLLFRLVPCLTLAVPLTLWRLYPSVFSSLSFKYSVLFFLCVSSIGVYGILGAGWCRNRRYASLGAVRSVAQTLSYEVCLSLILIQSILYYLYDLNHLKLSPLIRWLFLSGMILFVTLLAETNRSPFDFSEGESELVRGFNTEFSSVPFVMIFLAEYLSILFMTLLIRLLFNRSCYTDVIVFLLLWRLVFVWCRGTLPRLRYDQLMSLAWKRFLPTVLGGLSFLVAL